MCSLCKKWLDEGWVVQSRLGCYSYNPFRSSPGLADSNSVLVPAVCVCLVAWMNSESLPCDVPQVIPHFEERRGHAWPTTWLPLLAMPTCDCSSLVTACTSTVHPPSLDFTVRTSSRGGDPSGDGPDSPVIGSDVTWWVARRPHDQTTLPPLRRHGASPVSHGDNRILDDLPPLLGQIVSQLGS